MTKYVLSLSKQAPEGWPRSWEFPPKKGVLPPGWPRKLKLKSIIDAHYSGSILAVAILDARHENTDDFDREILQVTARDQHGSMVRMQTNEGESHIWYEKMLLPIKPIAGIVHGSVCHIIVDDPTNTACLDVEFFGIENGPRVVLDIHGTDVCGA